MIRVDSITGAQTVISSDIDFDSVFNCPIATCANATTTTLVDSNVFGGPYDITSDGPIFTLRRIPLVRY